MSDEVVAAGLREQLEHWRAALAAGAERVGWKIGLNIPEVQQRLGIDAPVIGYLTAATQVAPGGTWSVGEHEALRIEPEIWVEVGPDGSIAAAGAAIELVDVGRPPDGLRGILARNVFHRAFVLGPAEAKSAPGQVVASVEVDGRRRAEATATEDAAEAVRVVERRLGLVDERLLPGDRIICGSLTDQVPVEPGQQVEVELEGLKRVGLTLEP